MTKEKTDTRGSSRNAAKTKAHILAKATQLFAVKGYEGTSLSDIVQATEVNKRMIYHYFGDKRGLYRAIFLHQWGELKEWFDKAFAKRMETTKPMSGRELLAEAVAVYFDFMVHHQEFMRLMMWEGLEGGEISRSLWKDIRGPLYVQMEFLIKAAQDEGVLDKQLDPAHFVVSFMGAISFYFAYAPSIGDMIGQEPLTANALEKRKQQLLYLLENVYRS
jgi:TetR/AcrR family transcriptional regulator